jgi:hypothetical protein
MTLCAVCAVQVETRSAGFMVEPQNQGQRFISDLASKPLRQFVSGLTSKPLRQFVSGLASKLVMMIFSSLASKLVATVSPGLASKPVARVSWFGPQNRQLRFGDLSHKITTTIFWFGPKNHVGFGLSVAPQNRRSEVGTGHASRSSGLLQVKASRARVFQSGLKAGRGATTDGARGIIVEVALSGS